jgi:hypothetical protein
MSNAADNKEDAVDGAFAWEPQGIWGIGRSDEPEVILLDASAGPSGPGGRRQDQEEVERVRGQRRRPGGLRGLFDFFPLALSASLAQARQRCEVERGRPADTQVVEVRRQRNPLRRPSTPGSRSRRRPRRFGR